MTLKLNLGCGRDIRKDYLNCDWSKDIGADKIVDLNKPLPFKTNSVDEIILNHVLEHFHEPLNLFKEIYRVSKNNALIFIRVPFFSHESSFSALDHYHHFTYTSFDSLDANHQSHWQSTGNFKTENKKLIWRKQFFFFSFFNLFPRIYQEIFCWIFPAKELRVILKVKK